MMSKQNAFSGTFFFFTLFMFVFYTLDII